MTIFRSYNIVYYDTLETLCPDCGYCGTECDLSKAAKLALVATTEYTHAKTELRLLRESRDLFAQFPDSRHPFVVSKLGLDISPEPDPAFEAALSQELREFLNPDHGFILLARLKRCEKKEQHSPPTEASVPDIACPRCSHFRILPENFYLMVGVRRPT